MSVKESAYRFDSSDKILDELLQIDGENEIMVYLSPVVNVGDSE